MCILGEYNIKQQAVRPRTKLNSVDDNEHIYLDRTFQFAHSLDPSNHTTRRGFPHVRSPAPLDLPSRSQSWRADRFLLSSLYQSHARKIAIRSSTQTKEKEPQTCVCVIRMRDMSDGQPLEAVEKTSQARQKMRQGQNTRVPRALPATSSSAELDISRVLHLL